MRSLLQLLRLSHHVHPADHRDRRQAKRSADDKELLGELVCELSALSNGAQNPQAHLVGVSTTAHIP